MSRGTVDLQAVRFFLGYGLVFILQLVLTIVLAGAVMIAVEPKLGLIALAPVPFVIVISYRYGRRARPAIGEVQQRIAELTADAEENITGVRVVKAFARESRQLQRFRRSSGRVFEQAMVTTRLEATYNPVIGFLPQLGLAAVLLLGGQAVIHAHLTLGQFTSFYLYLNMLISPMRSLGVTLNLAQRATASGARIFQLLDREPRLRDHAGRTAAAGGQRPRAAARRDAALRGPARRARHEATARRRSARASARAGATQRLTTPRGRCCATSTSMCRRAGRWRWWARRARARRAWWR